MIGVLHGLALRVVSLAARLALLTWVLPRLPPGEVTRYLLVSTAVVLVGRLLGLGLEDELPLVVRGELVTARRLYPASGVLLVAAVLVGLAALEVGPGGLGVALVVACGALAMASTILLGGLVRTLSPAAYERLGNLPALLVLGAALVTPGLDAPRLVLFVAAAQVLCCAAEVLALGLSPAAGAWGGAPLLAELRGRLRAGAAKLASTLLLVLQLRGLGWAPTLLGRPADDGLSLAVLVGEAGVQLGSVLVQRHYAEYARGGGTDGQAARRAGASWLGLAGVGGLAAALLASPLAAELPPGLDLRGAPWAFVQAGALVATLEARYFLWSRGKHAFAEQVAWLLVTAAVVLVGPPGGWLVATTVGAGLVAAAAVARLVVGTLPRPHAAG